MSFAEYLNGLRGKSVAVVGAGISNGPLIAALLAAGIETTICDKRQRADFGSAADNYEGRGAKLRLGDDYLDDLHADVIFRTPGLMPTHPALVGEVARGAVLTSEMEVFLDVCPCKTIAVTGSDGKTTTTTIIAEILKREGLTVHVGGNIGTPLLCGADDMDNGDVAVLELSSFQLITMKKSPNIAVVTNITPNHLDIHSGMEEYIAAKRNIFIHQKSAGRAGRAGWPDSVDVAANAGEAGSAGKADNAAVGAASAGSIDVARSVRRPDMADIADRAVFNLDNEAPRRFAADAKSEVLFFSRSERVENGVYLDGADIVAAYDGYTESIMKADSILLPGAHNVDNYMAAFAAVRGLASIDAMRETAEQFQGVRHRIELVRELRGVRYYNDSIASSPTRTIAGLRAFDKKVILIAGGKDKGVGFDELGEEIAERVKLLVLVGLTADRIREAVLRARGYSGEPEIIIYDDFGDAVRSAASAAVSGDVVLLSPACTSFDRFRNFEERGDVFREIVMGLR
ncbi:MAG: Mur ligase family protein [Oscillospiraceae bacterium]|nr:Mur ligase family protein [Oscillospiraceae bacterium]